MPNPDGSPTREELIAANPGLAIGGMSAPVPAPISPLQEDLLGRLEANPNGRIAPLTQAQALGLNSGSIAPRQPEAAPTGKMVPEYNSAGEQIGTKPEVAGPALFQNPFAARATPPVPSGGRVGVENQPKAPAAKPAEGGPITYQGSGGKPPEAPAGPSGFFVPAGAGAKGKPGNPFANQIRAIDESKTQNMLMRGLLLDDARATQQQMAQQVAELQAMQGQHEAAAEEHKKKVENAEAIYSRVLEDAPNDSIDANHWWGERSTGQSLALMIGAGLAGFAAGFSGRGGNEVIDQINRQVEQDIAVQKANIANRREGYNAKVAGAKTTYEMIRAGVQDDEAAAALTKAWVFDRMALEAKQRAAASQDLNVQQNAQQFIDGLNMQKAQLQDKALASMMAGNGGFDRAKFLARKDEYMKMNVPSDQAEMQAARDLGLTNRNVGVVQKGEEGGKGSPAERQFKIDAQNKAYEQMHRNPVVRDNADTSEKIAAFLHIPSALAPETAKHKGQIESVNMQANAPIMGAFKDNEGRIPPAVVDALHNTDISINDPPEVKAALLEAKRQIPNTMAQFLPGVTPQNPGSGGQNLMNQVRGYKPIQ